MTGTDEPEIAATEEQKPKPGIMRRALRSVLLLAAAGFAFVLVTAILLTPQFLQFVMERALSSEPLIVRAERLKIPDVRSFLLTGVTIADDKGVWARTPEIAIRWHPRALLDGDLEIVSIKLARFTMERLPETNPTADETPIIIDWPRSFLAIHVRELSVARLELRTPAGLDTPAIVTMIGKLTAAAQFRNGLLLARLDAVRTDGVPERVTIRADVNEPARRVLLDFVASSPTEGWIAHELARQLGVPRAPVRVAFVGSGPPEKWSGELDLVAGNVAQGKLKLTVVEPPAEPEKTKPRKRRYDADEDRDLAVTGDLTLGKAFIDTLELPDDLALQVGYVMALDGRLAVRDRVLTTAQVQLDNGFGLHLAAAGKDPWKVTDVAATLTGDTLKIDDLVIGPGTLRGLLTLESQRLRLTDLVMKVDHLALPDLKVETISGTGELRTAWGKDPEAGIVTFTGTGGFREVGQADEAGFRLYGPATWEAAGHWDGPKKRVVLAKARLGAKGFGLVADGSYAVATASLAGKLQIRADSLGPITGGKYAGRLSLDAEGQRTGERLNVTLKGRAEGLSSPELPNLAGLGAIDIAADISSSQAGGTAKINVASDAFVVAGDGSMDERGIIAADVTARPKDASALSKLIGMPIDAKSLVTAHLGGARQSPALRARIDVPRLGSLPFQYRDVVLDIDLKDIRNAPQGNLVLRGDGPVGYMRGLVKIASADSDHLAVRDILIDNPVATFTGGFDIDRRNGVVSGELDGISGDFGVLEKGLDLEAEGAFSLTIKMAQRGTLDAPRQLLAMTVKGSNMATVLADREAVTADKLDARARIVLDGGLLDAKALSSARGQLRLQGYKSSGLSLDDFNVSIGDRRQTQEAETAGGAGDLTWTLKVLGDYYGALALDGAGAVRLGKEDTAVEISKLSGRLIDRPLSLEAPALYVSTATGDRLGPLSLLYGKGRLKLDYETTAQSLRANLDAQGVNIAIIPLLLGLPPFDGELTGKASLLLDSGAPQGQADLALRVEETDTQNVPAFALTLKGAIIGEPRDNHARLNFGGDMRGEGLSGTIAGDIPLIVTRAVAKPGAKAGKATNELLVRPSLDLDPARPVVGRFDWDGPVQSLMAFMPPLDDLLEGQLKARLALGGTVNNPQLSGSARLTNGRYEQLGFGTVLENLDVAVRLDGNAITLTSLMASDGNGGSVKAHGGFTLDRDWLPVGELTATLKSARIINMDGVRAELSGDAIYKRDAKEAILKGNLRIDRVEAGLDEKLPREITTLKVREINKPGGDNSGIVAPKAPKIAALTAFDLKVTAPRRLFVRGRGLDSEWGGNLTVGGSAETPDLRGKVELVRGVFSFAGKDFTLTSGNLRFDGGGKIDPVMNVKAEYASADITARLTLTGPLSRPELALSSTPTLPQDEILSRVLFGTSVQKLSALEAVQLASAITSLTSGGGFDVFGKTRGILGLDRLSIGSNGVEGTGTALTGGKYLTRDIYLEITTDTSTGESRAIVRYDITRKLQVEAGVGAADDTSIGVRWKEDY